MVPEPPASGRRPAPRAGGVPAEPAVLQGTIERVTYADETTLYTVLKLRPESGYAVPDDGGAFRSERVTAVGRAERPSEGLRVRLAGQWGRHATHGLQFEFEALEVLAPADAEGLVRYLSSGVFQGIGDTLARRIVAALGTEALERIQADPAALDGIRGLRPTVAERLVDTLRVELGSHQAHAFLRGLGLGPIQAAAVLAKLGPDCEAAIRADPYVLARGIPGIGFAIADRAARALDLAEADPRRLRAGLLHALESGASDGHTCLPRPRLVELARELLGGVADAATLDAGVAELARREEVVLEPPISAESSASFPPEHLAPEPGESPEAPEASESSEASESPESAKSPEPAESGEPAEPGAEPGGSGARPQAPPERVYLPGLAHCERRLARNLAELQACAPARPLAGAEDMARIERSAGLVLHESQRAAVLGLLATPVGLLTGGPGVGKTTITRTLVQLAAGAGCEVLLASPTGRAAKRLAEATGRPASTVHRLLGYEPAKEGFLHDERNPLQADLVVIDEVSMLDVVLAHHLLKALQPPTRLVLVGDPDQLPSVGPGNVLSDLIASGVVPVHRLTHIYRQAAQSLIVTNAHRILRGEPPVLPPRGDTDADFYLFLADDPLTCADRLVEVVTRRIPETFGLDWTDDVQVIAPMYKGECGVDALNDRLRAAQGVGGLEVRRGDRVWRVGDRVVHTRNDYEKEVFNGDMGRIVTVDPDASIVVRYPEREVAYQGAELSDLRPAFAITVHRAQGGEFPAVVMPLVTQHWMMLQRHLLYTAVTRARRLVVLVGSQRALRMALDNAEQRWRESALAERLRAAVAVP